MSTTSPLFARLLGLAAVAVLVLAVLVARPGGGPDGLTEASVVGGGVAAPSPPVRTRVEERTYAVTGARADEILASMAAAAPRTDGETFFGLTVTELSFRYVHRAEADSCRLHDVQVTLDVSVALPAWTPAPDAPYALRRDWARFDGSLRRHEDHHRVLAERGAERIRAEMDGLAAPTCAGVDAEARRRAERLRIETDAAHRRYDDETGHGRTQGAVWPRT